MTRQRVRDHLTAETKRYNEIFCRN